MKFIHSHLAGTVSLPESKSLWQRELIAAFVSGQSLAPQAPCDDVITMMEALQALQESAPHIHCRQSGATLRFLLPLAAALGRTDVEFVCDDRLLRRPLPLPFPVEQTSQGYRLTEALHGGGYTVDASATSQVVSGLLMALPLLDSDSSIMLTGGMVSQGYIDMTLTILRRHGITVEKVPGGWHIPGGQVYHAAPPLMEGDWSAAAQAQSMASRRSCFVF